MRAMTNKSALPPLTHDLVDAFTASAWAWLMWLAHIVARLVAPRRSRRLHLFIARLEREVEAILFLRAVLRFGPPPLPMRLDQPAPLPGGGGALTVTTAVSRPVAPSSSVTVSVAT